MSRRVTLTLLVLLPLVVEWLLPIGGIDLPGIDRAIPAEPIALILGVVLALVVRAWRRVSNGYPTQPTLAVVEKHETAFREIGNADSIAASTQQLFWERESWIYRSVEQIEFAGRKMVRRRISIDFEVPAHAIELNFGEGDAKKVVRVVPLSLLRSWPPVLNFDLEDQDESPLSPVSRTTTNAIDERVLKLLARSALPKRARPSTRRSRTSSTERARRPTPALGS